MKELTLIEMNDVSGAGIQDILAGNFSGFMGLVGEVTDTIVGGVMGAISFSSLFGLQGGTTGGSKGGGLLGVGVLTMAVGSIWGAIQGAVWGAIAGGYNGAEWSNTQMQAMLDSVMNGTGGGYKI
ncbi:hypothetical protein M8013_11115 [Enterobacteriaceae bacterium H4N4]|uniref:Colicin V synthesis protein n=1 Tax=Silvania confinis TaxID=2926470 RepID=A0A9J6QED7_9ENTR|nr:hypothetical protein [Silvania confinis]MCU6669297.1 hypothetical protein [Silvania confinis]